MTSKERFTRMYQHKEADRVPIVDHPWEGTISRWKKEGMPADMDWRDYFQVDKQEVIGVNVSPRYPVEVIEDTDSYVIVKSEWGVTMKHLKEEDSTPEFLDFTVTDPSKWAEAKKRMLVNRDRIDWTYLKNNYPKWVADGRWIVGGFWFGFDVTHSWAVGTETVLIAMIEEPEWLKDMFSVGADMCIKHMEMIWDEGYTFDCISWPDDMGYKNTTFFSLDTYRDLLKPYHKRVIDWAHSKGIYTHLHSCGNISKFIPDLLDIGLDALNPLEVKAGVNPEILKQEYGKTLVLHGGIDASLWNDKEKIIAEVERIVPILMKDGGYIFSSDHSIPNAVSAENFREIVATVKRMGRY